MFLTFVFLLFILLIVYVLFAPIDLFIDTSSNQYYVQIKGLAKAQVEGHKEEVLRIKLMTFFMKFYFYPLRKQLPVKKKKRDKEMVKKKRKGIGLKKGLRLLQSFKIKRLFVEVDTGNYLTNAKLYPLFAFLNYHVGVFRINFEGRSKMALHLRNRPINIIKSFINF